MPDMDGLEVLRYLRANQITQVIPVIMITAKVELISPKDYSSYGIMDAIAKPFAPFQLIEKIAKSLGWTPKNQFVTFSLHSRAFTKKTDFFVRLGIDAKQLKFNLLSEFIPQFSIN